MLPSELWMHIVSFSDPKTLRAIQVVNREGRDWASQYKDTHYWRDAAVRLGFPLDIVQVFEHHHIQLARAPLMPLYLSRSTNLYFFDRQDVLSTVHIFRDQQGRVGFFISLCRMGWFIGMQGTRNSGTWVMGRRSTGHQRQFFLLPFSEDELMMHDSKRETYLTDLHTLLSIKD